MSACPLPMTWSSRSKPVRSAEALRKAEQRSSSLPSAMVSSGVDLGQDALVDGDDLLTDDRESNAELPPLPTDVTDADRHVSHEKNRQVAVKVYTPAA